MPSVNDSAPPDPNLRWNAMRLPMRYRGRTVTDLALPEDVRSSAWDFISRFPERWVPEDTALRDFPEDRALIGRGLTIMGVPKTGKTELGCAIMTEVVLGYPDATALFCPLVDYMHAFNERHTWARQRDTVAEESLILLDVALSRVLDTALVLIDDVGREHMTASSAAADELYRVLRSRERRGLVTLVTTSLTTPSLMTAYQAHLADFMLRSFDRVVLEPR